MIVKMLSSVSVVFLLLISLTANATPISGVAIFDGGTITADGDISSLTQITFGGVTTVDDADGDFTSAIGDTVSFHVAPLDLSFAGPSTLFASFGTFEFYLDTLIYQVDIVNSMEFLGISGIGHFVDTTGVLEDSDGVFNISTQQPGIQNGSDFKFSFSSSSETVPEPASLVLMGLGLAGLAFAQRKQMRNHSN